MVVNLLIFILRSGLGGDKSSTRSLTIVDISKYTAFFHDGSIMDIQHIKNKIEISMASAEMDEEDVKDDNILSKDDSIQGKLHIEGIKSIEISGKPFSGIIQKLYDNGRIFDFVIMNNFVELLIDWVNFPPKPEINEFSIIKIEAEKIWWENIPNLADRY
jgi:hypothetical protein